MVGKAVEGEGMKRRCGKEREEVRDGTVFLLAIQVRTKTSQERSQGMSKCSAFQKQVLLYFGNSVDILSRLNLDSGLNSQHSVLPGLASSSRTRSSSEERQKQQPPGHSSPSQKQLPGGSAGPGPSSFHSEKHTAVNCIRVCIWEGKHTSFPVHWGTKVYVAFWLSFWDLQWKRRGEQRMGHFTLSVLCSHKALPLENHKGRLGLQLLEERESGWESKRCSLFSICPGKSKNLAPKQSEIEAGKEASDVRSWGPLKRCLGDNRNKWPCKFSLFYWAPWPEHLELWPSTGDGEELFLD